jgi:hypothetical protein
MYTVTVAYTILAFLLSASGRDFYAGPKSYCGRYIRRTVLAVGR